jgi:hypothetical protein
MKRVRTGECSVSVVRARLVHEEYANAWWYVVLLLMAAFTYAQGFISRSRLLRRCLVQLLMAHFQGVPCRAPLCHVSIFVVRRHRGLG